MSWRLRTEVDLSTGEEVRLFVFTDEEGNALSAVPEGPALELVRELMKTYPDAIQGLLAQINTEQGQPAAPPPSQPAPYEPLYAEEEEEEAPRVPRTPIIRQPQQTIEDDVEDTPLRIPSDQPITLQNLAPKGEPEAPQG